MKASQRAVRIGRLTTVMEVAAEIGRVYRDARHNKIDAVLGNRLASILSAMRQCLETAEFERRIASIEAAVAKASPSSRVVFDAFGARSELAEPDRDDGLPSSDHRRH
jgi:hypothetical protein